jgi:MoxR-like ATPase
VSAIQAPPPETRHAQELEFLRAFDKDARPPGWLLSPRAVVTFILGSAEKLRLDKAPDGVPDTLEISPKFVGDRGLVQRATITLAGQRGLLLVGEPGTAKSMLSELLAAAISGNSARTVQGTAGTTEDHLRYGWNYAMLIAKGPHREALTPSPVLSAMRTGTLARIEEVTRCLPEVQDALVSILSDRRMSIPELGDTEFAKPGFNLIATANLRDRGVSEMSSALKRRFNFELVTPIADLAAETALVRAQAQSALTMVDQTFSVDDAVLEALVTVFRDLRSGQTVEGWSVSRPSTVISTAEAVGVATSLGMAQAFFPSQGDVLSLLPEYLLGVVLKDEPKDRAHLLSYWDGAVRRRAEGKARLWKRLLELRDRLEERS